MKELCYSELITLKSFEERLDYLKLWDVPHTSPRSLSQSLYKHPQWLATREVILKRDMAFDLGIFGVYIYGPVYVHHMDPVTEDMIKRWDPKLFDPENLISTSLNTHNMIHYKPKEDTYVERQPNDTKLW